MYVHSLLLFFIVILLMTFSDIMQDISNDALSGI